MHPRTRSAATRGWDYVVVGAGAAGCVVAGRLSQTMPDVRIALIEAGGMRLGLTTKIPGTAFIASTSPRRNWNFETEPVPALNGRKLWWFQGRILGGSGAAARRSDVGRRLMDHPRRRAGNQPCIHCHSRRPKPLLHLENAGGTSRPDAARVSVGRDRQIGANQQMRRSNAATSPLRSRIRADNPFPEAVSSAGLGYLRRQTSGHEARHRRRGSQARRDHASHLGHRR